MKFAGLLPHLYLFGGVRRYIEMGNELISRGHQFTLYTPEGAPPTWTTCRCKVKAMKFVSGDRNDIAIGGDPGILKFLAEANALKKIFYAVLEDFPEEKKIFTSGQFTIMANSSGIRQRIMSKYRVACLDGIGAVNTQTFYPAKIERDPAKFRVICYGRISRKRKGTARVIEAVKRLYKKYPQLELQLFDSVTGDNPQDASQKVRLKVPLKFYMNVPQDQMAKMYSGADVFISAERRAGWNNTSAEAMACGVPVICTASGTTDFAFDNDTAIVIPNDRINTIAQAIEKLLTNENLRTSLAQKGYNKIQEFTWPKLGNKLEKTFRQLLK
ncbi:glycosyltransferase family 4 protein [Candidatus Margulisiibacteriota bacterium]